MFINKIGKDHLDIGKNNQDYGVERDDYGLVCDGCSEGEHSEVGAKIYTHLISNGFTPEDAFIQLVGLFGQNMSTIRDYLCFTILSVSKGNSIHDHAVTYCGDGYIILEDYDGNIIFKELTDGDYPKYYIYNYCNPEKLTHYKEGVRFNTRYYSSCDYIKVGIASDGLRFILKEEALLPEFIEVLKTGIPVKMKRFINKHQSVFRDDITIVF